MLKKLPIATSEGTIVVGTSARVTPAVKIWETNGIDVRHLKVSEKCWNISWVGELSIVSEIFQHLLYDSDSGDLDIVPVGVPPKNLKGHISKAPLTDKKKIAGKSGICNQQPPWHNIRKCIDRHVHVYIFLYILVVASVHVLFFVNFW